jgi:hypothetical protein
MISEETAALRGAEVEDPSYQKFVDGKNSKKD